MKGVLSSQVTVRKLNNGRLEFNKYILQMFNNLNNNDEGSTMFLANDVPSQIKKLILKVVLNFTLGIEENDDINLSLFQNGSNIFKAAGLFIYSDYLPFLFPLDIKSMAKSNMISSYVFVRDYLAKKLEEVKKKEYIINGDDDGGVDTSQTPLIESYYKLYLQGLIGYDSILLSIVDIIIASVDTTSNSISFIIARLTNHPEIQSKIYEEIMSNDINNNSNNISFSDHSKYPYIISIMNGNYKL